MPYSAQEPFVVSVDPVVPERRGTIDVFRPMPAQEGPAPVLMFVHGGPVPADLTPTPRDWPVYLGYGSLAARAGAIGVTVDHRLHDSTLYPTAADDVAAAVDAARALEGADPDRVVLWFCSGGGLLLADWLGARPPWLRGVAATYPVLAPLPGRRVDPRFRPIDRLSTAGNLPILLTHVGRERTEIAQSVADFVAAASEHRVDLDVIDVPDGRHGFDMLDHTDQSRQAIARAMTWVTARLDAR